MARAGLIERDWPGHEGFARSWGFAGAEAVNALENREDWKATSRARITLELSRGTSL
jgi:hypothetical protein